MNDDPVPVFGLGILRGTSGLSLAAAMEDRSNPVLTWADVDDAPAAYVADPFLFREAGVWHMFFEVMNLDTDRGEVAVATSVDCRRWSYERRVLVEPFHVSYPLVFASNDSVFMIPEARRSGAVRLYRADPFPFAWIYVCDLVAGPFGDPTVFEHGGRWWMFAESSRNRHNVLRLFHADHLLGPWIEHVASPIVRGDATRARPGGRVATVAGRLTRYAQVCAPRYGTAVRAFTIDRLDEKVYAETEIAGSPVLRPGAADWRRSGMHHVDRHELDDRSWIAAVDGWTEVDVETFWATHSSGVSLSTLRSVRADADAIGRAHVVAAIDRELSARGQRN